MVSESRSCVVSVSSEPQFISSSSTSSSSSNSESEQLAAAAETRPGYSSCGSTSHPWRLEAPVGQRINISLLDFSNPAHAPRDRRDVTACRQQYGYVLDKSNKKNVSMCAGGGAELRQSAVYQSNSHAVELILIRTHGSGFSFLVKLQGLLKFCPYTTIYIFWSNAHNMYSFETDN